MYINLSLLTKKKNVLLCGKQKLLLCLVTENPLHLKDGHWLLVNPYNNLKCTWVLFFLFTHYFKRDAQFADKLFSLMAL